MQNMALARSSQSYVAIIYIATVVLALTGCALNPDRLVLGASRDEVLRTYGAPTADIALAGGERLQYSRQPFGRQVYNIDLDAAGKVVAANQALTESQFALVQLDAWNAADVERAFGKPAQVGQVYSFEGAVWSYRYNYFGTNKQFHVFIDPGGVVRRTQATQEIESRPRRR